MVFNYSSKMKYFGIPIVAFSIGVPQLMYKGRLNDLEKRLSKKPSVVQEFEDLQKEYTRINAGLNRMPSNYYFNSSKVGNNSGELVTLTDQKQDLSDILDKIGLKIAIASQSPEFKKYQDARDDYDWTLAKQGAILISSLLGLSLLAYNPRNFVRELLPEKKVKLSDEEEKQLSIVKGLSQIRETAMNLDAMLSDGHPAKTELREISVSTNVVESYLKK